MTFLSKNQIYFGNLNICLHPFVWIVKKLICAFKSCKNYLLPKDTCDRNIHRRCLNNKGAVNIWPASVIGLSVPTVECPCYIYVLTWRGFGRAGVASWIGWFWSYIPKFMNQVIRFLSCEISYQLLQEMLHNVNSLSVFHEIIWGQYMLKYKNIKKDISAMYFCSKFKDDPWLVHCV